MTHLCLGRVWNGSKTASSSGSPHPRESDFNRFGSQPPAEARLMLGMRTDWLPNRELQPKNKATKWRAKATNWLAKARRWGERDRARSVRW
ncbi:unnamed protein product [Protopolystoma xenopodis]|uniref:Uncharacterized protein n=1 Tax=Protopolystoma xenopodis TaxID=117903 RepID=A0A448WU17_9PLAT|nr:unnamed protein product [Protopolystoma xenopodis]